MPTIELYEYELPIAVDDLNRVADLLREAKVFCAGPTAADIYDWKACRKAHADGITVAALLDRNVFNDVVILARTASAEAVCPLSGRARFGAAVMSYLLCSNILVDPGLAVHEWPAGALEELTLFRRADETDAATFVEIALARADRIAPGELPPPKVHPTPQTFRGSVSGREEHRLAVLKICELELAALNPCEKIERFFRWTFDHYIFLPAAISLAAQQFSPSRRKPLLRRVASPDRQRAMSAVDNAVWDLLVAMHWAERVERQLSEKKFWILCSRDESLKALARNLHFSREAGQTRESALRTMFIDLWGSLDGGRLATHLLQLMLDAKNPIRWCNQDGFKERIDDMTRHLEHAFLSWQPAD
ncbi:MAG TPA: hypothetical protein VJU77_16710 [Chthoniobacterales bacterium]|nr:hypothetical protein [Chthoniobacterales bacterium]